EPRSRGLAPSWGTKPFPREERGGGFVVLASGYEDEGALPIRANGRVLGASLKAGSVLDFALPPGRFAYLVPAKGKVAVNGVELNERDGAAIRDEQALRIRAGADSELVLVETGEE